MKCSTRSNTSELLLFLVAQGFNISSFCYGVMLWKDRTYTKAFIKSNTVSWVTDCTEVTLGADTKVWLLMRNANKIECHVKR